MRLSYACQIGARAMATLREAATIKKKRVSGSFLFKIPDEDHTKAKVALFRRSAKVRTYQGKLGSCSGSMDETDASPLATALREILEETRLPPSSLSLLRVGKPYIFTDESIGREWSINPFAFRIKDVSEGGKGEEGIILDWEHDGIEWFDPMDVSGSDEFGGVPKLIDGLQRVWPEYHLGLEAGRVLNRGLQILHDDHEHGAQELGGTAVSTLRDVIHHLGISRPIDETWWWSIRMAAWHICQSRPSMGAPITSSVIKALAKIRAIFLSEMCSKEKIKQMTEALSQQLDERTSINDRICSSFTDYVRSKIMKYAASKKSISILTLSSSSTIFSSLLKATSTLGATIDLRVLESRPLFEGVGLAARLLQEELPESKVKVTVYSDASAALAARGIDILLLGADRLSSAGDVYNKTGSLPVVLSARYVAPNAKILVVSDTKKVAGPGSMEEHTSEENDPSELMQAWRGTVPAAEVVEDALAQKTSKAAVTNTYFEWVPSGLIDAYVTEEGIWGTEQIKDKSAWVGNETVRYFEDL
ncbi:translation initiation factor eIF-2B subunit family protein [Xylaria nigripes]|nr:translation initiation factor eIF-2B subunit family protein [Xylaria nigripes]